MSAHGLNDTNLFVYCRNNPTNNDDDDGEWVQFVVGAVVGGLIGGVIAGISSYRETGQINWASVAINAGVGALNGVVAATGLGMVAQAGISAAVSGVGNFAEQAISNGVNNVNYLDVAGNAALGGITSLIGSGAGKLIGGRLNNAGMELISRGRDKLLTGYIRSSVGQSHSSLIRQGSKLVTQGIAKVTAYRTISSVVGSIIGGGTSAAYNRFKRCVVK